MFRRPVNLGFLCSSTLMTIKKNPWRRNLALLYTSLLLFLSVQSGAYAQDGPYQLRRGLDIALVSAGTAGSLGGLLWRAQREPLNRADLARLETSDVWSWDRSAADNYSRGARTASDVLVMSSYVLPFTLLAFEETRGDVGTLVLMLLETVSMNEALTGLTKAAVQRARPYTYNENLSGELRTEDDNAFSFFSGHTSHAAALSFFTARVISAYTDRQWVRMAAWSGAVLLPATTGYLRYRAGKHFPTDIVVGYAVGATVGWLVPYLHRVRPNGDEKRAVCIEPRGLGVAVIF